MKVKLEKVLGYAAAVVIVVAWSFLVNWVVNLLWNWLVPLIFHGPELSFWQMYGLVFLLNLLSCGFFSGNRNDKNQLNL